VREGNRDDSAQLLVPNPVKKAIHGQNWDTGIKGDSTGRQGKNGRPKANETKTRTRIGAAPPPQTKGHGPGIWLKPLGPRRMKGILTR